MIMNTKIQGEDLVQERHKSLNKVPIETVRDLTQDIHIEVVTTKITTEVQSIEIKNSEETRVLTKTNIGVEALEELTIIHSIILALKMHMVNQMRVFIIQDNAQPIRIVLHR